MQSIEIQKNYAHRLKYIPTKISKTKEAHKKAIEKFSPEAKKADFELTQIYKNPDLSLTEKRQQVKEILKSLHENIKNEIFNA
uniref:Uncharacterized protein n=1 Tax=Acrobeloides nanus TaxID=290746 RepID=A0A914E309_9BILA